MKGLNREREKKGRRATGNKSSNRTVAQSTRQPVRRSPGSAVFPIPRTTVPLITLLTDFGTADYFVGAMKGVILSIAPKAGIVDITHEIPAHEIEEAAFTLLAAYPSFPAGTIHVAVVDPGVGSSRRPLIVEANNQIFVGPDNGIFSYVCERESDHQVFEVTNENYFCRPVSATFHGRDVFAPVAAALAIGVNPKDLGREIKTQIRLASLLPAKWRNGELKARIIHVDRFGNCVTNLTRAELTPDLLASGLQLRINGKTIRCFKQFFSEETGNGEKIFAIWGSAGFLEIAATNRSAAEILNAERGQMLNVLTNDRQRTTKSKRRPAK